MASPACVEAVIAACPAAADDDRAALGDAIDALLAAAAPGEVADAAAFCAHAAARLAPGESPARALGGLAAADLAIAFGCARGEPGALAAFERDYLPAVRAALGRMRAPAAVIDEQVQALRARVLVGDGARPPRIADYAGRGGLRRWLRAAAVRHYLNTLRDGGREAPIGDDDVLDALAAHGDSDPDLAYLKDRYRASFSSALTAAAASLQPVERAVLRYTFVDGLNLDALGRALRVSRATAHRRLADARTALLAATERELAARLRLSPDEVASLQRLVRSQLDVSVGQLLASAAKEPGA